MTRPATHDGNDACDAKRQGGLSGEIKWLPDTTQKMSARPFAIFASNDEMAAGVLHAARSIGLSVPEDLSIIGFDDLPHSAFTLPPLPISTGGRVPMLPMLP